MCIVLEKKGNISPSGLFEKDLTARVRKVSLEMLKSMYAKKVELMIMAEANISVALAFCEIFFTCFRIHTSCRFIC